jgi:gluconolactonase
MRLQSLRSASFALACCVAAGTLVADVSADERKITGDPAIVPADAQLEELWNDGTFTEGVAVGPDGTVYFSDIPFENKPGRVMKFDRRSGRVSVHASPSGKSNGLMFDRQGRLIACCGAMFGKRALCEIQPDGTLKVLVDRYMGKRLNAPNDLVIHPNGSIYFSDPRYVGHEPMELDHMSVYRFDPDGSLHRVTTDIEKPNGVVLSPDCQTLYVAETNNGSTDVTQDGPETKVGRMTLNAFPVKADGSLGSKRLLADYGAETGVDGMAVDAQGHVCAAVRAASRYGIIVYTPEGKERAYIPTPDLPTNCCFGVGDDSKTLYIAAGKGLYRIGLNIDGFHPATATVEK